MSRGSGMSRHVHCVTGERVYSSAAAPGVDVSNNGEKNAHTNNSSRNRSYMCRPTGSLDRNGEGCDG